MPSPVQAQITEEEAKYIKRAVSNGRQPSDIARELGKSYQLVYKVAANLTWKRIFPTKGRVLARRETKYTRALRDQIAKAKRAHPNKSNLKLASEMGLSESMVARAIRDARALMAARVQRMLLTSGSNLMAAKQYKLKLDEIEALLALAATQTLPEHLAAEAAED
jgi:hypothetical protein